MTAVSEEKVVRDSGATDVSNGCAVIVVNYGSHHLLERNLVPLHREDPDLTIVVVDNFSTDEERSMVERLADAQGWLLLSEATNRGFGAGVNRGASWAVAHGADQLLLLNPDACIQARDLARMRDRVTSDPMTMVAPIVRTPTGRTWFAGSVIDLSNGEIRGVDAEMPADTSAVGWLSGACLLISARLWEHVGGFDEDYFLYWEDVDLSYRVHQVGGKVEVLTDATAVHDQGGTQHTRTARAKSDTYYYHMVRNRLLFANRHLPWPRRIRWHLNAPKYAWRVVLHGGKRQLLHSRLPVLAASRGIRDALPMMRGGQHRARRRAKDARKPLIVLQSVPGPRPTTNPYNVMLAEALQARSDVDLRMFSWREALLHRHDVFHAHWPEALIERRGMPKTLVRRGLFCVLLVKWSACGTSVVRTVHNLDLPSGIGRFERLALEAIDRLTGGRIVLNPFTPTQTTCPVRTVLHGHYRPWFEGQKVPSPIPGRLAFFGMIRRYKGVESLVTAFRQCDRVELSLHVAGKPSSKELAATIRETAGADARITLTFEFLDTAALAEHVGSAELVVLPHSDMHNSGSAIAALSLGRPVLVQDNQVNRWLSSEVGPGWVHLYDGALTPDTLCSAVDELRTAPPLRAPDLSGRDWTSAAAQHVDLYRASVEKGRGRRALRKQVVE